MKRDIAYYTIDPSDFIRGNDIEQFKPDKLSCVYYLTDKNSPNKSIPKYVGKIPNKLELSEKDILTFLREIHILTSNHPSILKLKGWSFIENALIVTFYMKNGSLFDCIKKSTKEKSFFTPTQKQIILYGVSKGIEYLHSENIIDRDIKSSNILLDEKFYPKICDFNLSKFTSDIYSEDQSVKCYTPNYEAPEIHTQNGYNCSVDVYSFGRIMYELLADEIIKNDSKIDLDNPKIPLNFSEIIMECQNNEASCRPTFSDISEFFRNNFLENVDQKEFQSYLNFIENESKKAHMIKLNEKNDLNVYFYQSALSYLNYSNPIGMMKAKNLMKVSAYLGNSYGQFDYATILLAENDENGAKMFLRKAMDNDYLPAICLYGFILEKENKFLEAEDVFEKVAKFTDNLNRKEILQSIEKIVTLFQYKNNIEEAIRYIKFGIRQDNQTYSKFILKLKEIADKTNDKEAQFEYSKIIHKTNTNESIHYLELAANQGQIEACLKMNDLLVKSQLFSQKVERKELNHQKKIEEQEKYLKLAADQNSSEAFIQLGIIYTNKKNLKKAKEYFKKAIEIDKHSNLGILNYALILEKERLIETDEIIKIELIKEQFKYLKDLADEDFIPAKYHFARLMREIIDNKKYCKVFNMREITDKSYLKNLKEAFKNQYEIAVYDYADFLKKEADKGISPMQYKYGKILVNEKYPVFDKNKGLEYLEKAKNNHNEKAKRFLANLNKQNNNNDEKELSFKLPPKL